MSKLIDMRGKTIGLLTVTSYAGSMFGVVRHARLGIVFVHAGASSLSAVGTYASVRQFHVDAERDLGKGQHSERHSRQVA